VLIIIILLRPCASTSTSLSANLISGTTFHVSEQIIYKMGAHLLLAEAEPAHSGHWLLILPLSSCGLLLYDKVVQFAIGGRLGLNLCEPHCRCSALVEARGVHIVSCAKSAPGTDTMR